MTPLREAAQQALEAMEAADVDPHSSDAVYKAITALRAALAEPSKPLAEWQINDLIEDANTVDDVDAWSFRQGVYAAEKHHGVKP